MMYDQSKSAVFDGTMYALSTISRFPFPIVSFPAYLIYMQSQIKIPIVSWMHTSKGILVLYSKLFSDTIRIKTVACSNHAACLIIHSMYEFEKFC